jgi:hypothetical protein
VIKRTFVLMGRAAAFTTEALQIPILAIVALLLLMMTFGRVGPLPGAHERPVTHRNRPVV